MWRIGDQHQEQNETAVHFAEAADQAVNGLVEICDAVFFGVDWGLQVLDKSINPLMMLGRTEAIEPCGGEEPDAADHDDADR